MGTYSDKLKDLRWQKKRLKILERDNWRCANCLDDKSTLHIHHRIYIGNNDPWDYENDTLVTLCEKCHEYEKDHLADAVSELGVLVRQNFFAFTIAELFHGLEKGVFMWRDFDKNTFGQIIAWALADKKTLKTIVRKYADAHRDSAVDNE